jgi:hypothetical protein
VFWPRDPPSPKTIIFTFRLLQPEPHVLCHENGRRDGEVCSPLPVTLENLLKPRWQWATRGALGSRGRLGFFIMNENMSRRPEPLPPDGWDALLDTARALIEDTARLRERTTATQEAARRLRLEAQSSRARRRAIQRTRVLSGQRPRGWDIGDAPR